MDESEVLRKIFTDYHPGIRPKLQPDYITNVTIRIVITSKSDLISSERRMVVLNSDGSILQSSPQVVSHPCEIDVVDFPYDTQTCRLALGSWQYDTGSLQIQTTDDNYDFSEDITGNSEWKLEGLSSKLTLDATYEEADFQVVS
ncbi:unnamed protein product [Haemonchus placei]|uniref:Neur_chan_LBD domain-containing protein n=1 Tax=Haemonchus placei TaxID=6290 RepID=A0A0N4WVE0_HAEPC|nr:unnamed protein product [Haemonchus placei]